ncbi:hypothetical protein LTR46_011485 [Exophiala xenobiotica]|nr:hypothetical protein LTR46_011485 [Exophiala xenobiotica]
MADVPLKGQPARPTEQKKALAPVMMRIGNVLEGSAKVLAQDDQFLVEDRKGSGGREEEALTAFTRKIGESVEDLDRLFEQYSILREREDLTAVARQIKKSVDDLDRFLQQHWLLFPHVREKDAAQQRSFSEATVGAIPEPALRNSVLVQTPASSVSANTTLPANDPTQPHTPVKHVISFVCSFSHYGCEQTFKERTPWRRHVLRHMQLDRYHCKQKACATSGHRGFTAFEFRAHTSAKHPPPQRDQNYYNSCRRAAPESSTCGFCGEEFAGSASWTKRMTHVGTHYRKCDVNEREDENLRVWAIENVIIRDAGNGRYALIERSVVGDRRRVGRADARGSDAQSP